MLQEGQDLADCVNRGQVVLEHEVSVLKGTIQDIRQHNVVGYCAIIVRRQAALSPEEESEPY